MSDKKNPIPQPTEPLHEAFKKVVNTTVIVGKATEDQLKLFVDVLLPREEVPVQPVVAEDIVKAILEAVDRQFLNVEVVDDIVKTVNSGKSVLNRRVSKGIAAIPGKDGKIVYLVKKLGNTAQIKVDENGIADYTTIHLFDNIEAGDVVARIYPPRPGIPGRDVFGKDIPAPIGNPFQYKIDGSLEVQGDEATQGFVNLVAKGHGYLHEEHGSISVREELNIGGDLDYHFGHLDFIGKVKVAGDVMPGFDITAREGIEVKGSVRGGNLVAMNGPIIVDGFVFGGFKSKVVSGKSFQASIVQEVNAEIKGEITVLIEARDSNLRTESILKMEKGLLFGGKASVVCGAECSIIGSDAFTPTELEFVGDNETTVAFSELQVRIENHDKAIQLIRLHLGPYADNREQLKALNINHRQKMEDLARKLDLLEKGRKELSERQQLISQVSKKNEVKRINVHTKIYPGALIRVGDKCFSPEKETAGPISIDFDGTANDFKVGEQKGLECTYQASTTGDPSTNESKKEQDEQ